MLLIVLFIFIYTATHQSILTSSWSVSLLYSSVLSRKVSLAVYMLGLQILSKSQKPPPNLPKSTPILYTPTHPTLHSYSIHAKTVAIIANGWTHDHPNPSGLYNSYYVPINQ